MKRFLKSFAFVLILPLVCLSGCIFDGFDLNFGENNQNAILNKLSGFKVTSYSQSYELDDTIHKYSENVLIQLYANFAILNDPNHPSDITNKPNSNDDRNYDRIRVQPKADGENDATNWLWTFSSSTLLTQTVYAGQKTYYSDPVNQQNYYNYFVTPYTTAMEIVVMQIIMEQTPTIFTIDTTTDGTPKIYFDAEKTIEITADCDKLVEIQEEFEATARYIGFAEADKTDLITYILNNVIGSTVLENHNKVYTSGDSYENCEYFVSQIVATEPELEKSFFEPYPIAQMKDYNKTLFFTDTNNGLSHINSEEYQSIIVKTKEDMNVMSVWLGFESEYDMQIDVSVNYVNSATKVVNVLATKTCTISQGTWNSNDIFNIDFSDSPITTWQEPNQSVTYSTTKKSITNENGLSSYYTVSENRVGIFDATNAQSSYLELVFKVHKDGQRTYYPFKVGINYIWTR